MEFRVYESTKTVATINTNYKFFLSMFVSMAIQMGLSLLPYVFLDPKWQI